MAALIIGGANGIGLAIAQELSHTENVVIVDCASPAIELKNTKFIKFNLLEEDYSVFEDILDIDKLVFTAGFGRLALFEQVSEEEMLRQMKVNAIAPMRVIKRFYDRIHSDQPFHTAIMVSIAGFMTSPFFSTYAATKAALKIFIETLNTELRCAGLANRILNVSPGSFKGSRFNGAENNDLTLLTPLAKNILDKMMAGEELFIPQYEEVYKHVLARYHNDPIAEGVHSYEYKLQRISANIPKS